MCFFCSLLQTMWFFCYYHFNDKQSKSRTIQSMSLADLERSSQIQTKNEFKEEKKKIFKSLYITYYIFGGRVLLSYQSSFVLWAAEAAAAKWFLWKIISAIACRPSSQDYSVISSCPWFSVHMIIQIESRRI